MLPPSDSLSPEALVPATPNVQEPCRAGTVVTPVTGDPMVVANGGASLATGVGGPKAGIAAPGPEVVVTVSASPVGVALASDKLSVPSPLTTTEALTAVE